MARTRGAIYVAQALASFLLPSILIHYRNELVGKRCEIGDGPDTG